MCEKGDLVELKGKAATGHGYRAQTLCKYANMISSEQLPEVRPGGRACRGSTHKQATLGQKGTW